MEEIVTRVKVRLLQKEIEKACIKHGLNLTVYNGRIGFVDQRKRKIVALWNPEHRLPDATFEEGQT